MLPEGHLPVEKPGRVIEVAADPLEEDPGGQVRIRDREVVDGLLQAADGDLADARSRTRGG